MGKKAVVYDVQKIVGVKVDENDNVFYEVKWKGYSFRQNSWEPEGNLRQVRTLINKFYRERITKNRPLTNALRPAFQKLEMESTLKNGRRPGRRGRPRIIKHA